MLAMNVLFFTVALVEHFRLLFLLMAVKERLCGKQMVTNLSYKKMAKHFLKFVIGIKSKDHILFFTFNCEEEA